MVKHLSSAEAAALDVELMGPNLQFTLEQLMELAGQSCANAIAKVFPCNVGQGLRILVVSGPGNNGGDGLVAARHLQLFGYCVELLVPKLSAKSHYTALINQARHAGVTVAIGPDIDISSISPERYDVIVDAVFGFSFSGDIRPPFDQIIPVLACSGVPIASIDIPSGWNVDTGPPDKSSSSTSSSSSSSSTIHPHLVISLTAPKLCMQTEAGHRVKEHWLGGRFVPPAVSSEYQLNLPQYPGVETVVKLG